MSLNQMFRDAIGTEDLNPSAQPPGMTQVISPNPSAVHRALVSMRANAEEQDENVDHEIDDISDDFKEAQETIELANEHGGLSAESYLFAHIALKATVGRLGFDLPSQFTSLEALPKPGERKLMDLGSLGFTAQDLKDAKSK